jgi:hypothetical protein
MPTVNVVLFVLVIVGGALALTPVPVKGTPLGCGLGTLSETFTDALLAPREVGVNLTLIVQLAPALTVAPQVFDCEKSPAFAPISVMELIVIVPVPVFVTVTTCGPEVVEVT